MSKTITLVIVMGAASLVTVRYVDDSQQETPMSREVHYFDEETTDLAENYGIFKSTFDATLQSLEAREMNLTDATARVYATAKKHCPIYLERVVDSDPDDTIEGSIAHNLVGHLSFLEEIRPPITQRVVELETERQNLANQFKVAKTVR
jgi:hypothetical protein